MMLSSVSLEALDSAAELGDLALDHPIEAVENAADQEPKLARLFAVLADLLALLSDVLTLLADVLAQDRHAGHELFDMLRKPFLATSELHDQRFEVGHGSRE